MSNGSQVVQDWMADQMGADNGNATLSVASFTSGSTRLRPTAYVSADWGFKALFHPTRLQRAFTDGWATAIKFANIGVQFARRHSLSGWRVLKNSPAKLCLCTRCISHSQCGDGNGDYYMNYANGGLHNTAYYLKGKGRGKDTELVHMTPKEVKGLQALAMAHGGSLTINPSTGLPEAGFLEDILPVVAAAGLTYLTAGAATPMLMGAGMGATSAGILAGAGSGALISGGMAAVQGKDVGQAALMGGIGGGISGGLGAYADANVLGVGVAPPPADALTQAGTQAVTDAGTQAVTDAGTQAVTQGSTNAAGYNVATPNSSGTGFINPESGLGTAPATNTFGPTSLQSGGPDLTNAMVSNVPRGTTPGAGLEVVESMLPKNVPVDPGISLAEGQKLAGPTSYYSGLGSGAMDTAKKIGIQALPGITGAMGSETYDEQGIPQDPYNSRLKRISPDFRAYEPPRPNPYYSARYAANGGVMDSFDDESGVDMAGGGVARPLPRSSGSDPGIYKDANPTTRGQDAYTASLTNLNSLLKRANIKGLPALKAAAAPLSDIQEAAKGGVMSGLGGYSDGGRMLKGPGDGMSDSIPGVIGRKQPARLADGEFVVPADVVSHLGNGSTDAGAKRLYAMMDNIRKARTGKKKQAPAVKADRYMPA